MAGQDRQACISKILDNYGCEERLFGTVLQVGQMAQVTLTHLRNGQLVSGGAANAYTKADPSSIIDKAKSLVLQLFVSSEVAIP